MTILVDTHAILWWLAGDKRLSPEARSILGNPSHRRVVSMASLWEIAIKMSTGGLTVRDLDLRGIVDMLSEQEFIILPIRLPDLLRLGTLPPLHRDPFDRLLIAQVLEEGIPLLTADTTISQYPVKTKW